MKRRIGPTIVVTLAVSAAAGVLVASNMGHVATVQLDAATSGVSVTGVNTINLPYDVGPNIVNAKDLMNDITFANVVSVSRFLKATDSLQSYTGRKGGGLAFPITAGECYYVKLITTTNYPVVGSSLPDLPITLQAAAAGVSNSGVNFVSLPFNITARNAKGLMDDIGFSNVISVSRFLKATDSFQSYTGRKGGGLAFPISHDECYYIKMLTTVNYTPTHY